MITLNKNNHEIRLFTSNTNNIEGEALRQLYQTAELKGIKIAIGMPDLHPGKGSPIGAAFASKDIIFPFLIGNDVGCGMGFWETTLKANKIKRDKWVKKLSGLESPWDGDIKSWLDKYDSVLSSVDSHSNIGLGTIGGGNHFAELQSLEKVYDLKEFEKLDMDKKCLFLLVHSGSRGFGNSLLRRHTEKYGALGLQDNTSDALKYLEQQAFATNWGRLNRALIAYRFILSLGGKCKIILDSCHNSISKIKLNDENFWLHRKGVTAVDTSPIIIPGSRGAFTFLVKPLSNQIRNLYSLAHGAGRKWNRTSSKGRLKQFCNAKSLTYTDLGSRVICEDKNLLYEEAPQVYKNIDHIIRELEKENLIRVIAKFRPLITYKTRKR